MNHCHSCGQPFTPRRPYHRYCDACYRDLQASRRGPLHPHHPRLTWLDPKNLLLWFALIVIPALLLLGLGHLLT